MADDIGHGLLDDAINLERPALADGDLIRQTGNTALEAGPFREILHVPLNRGAEAQVFKYVRPQLRGDAPHGIDY